MITKLILVGIITIFLLSASATSVDMDKQFPKATHAYSQFGIKVYSQDAFNAKFPVLEDSRHFNNIFIIMLKPGAQLATRSQSALSYKTSDRIAITWIYSQKLCFGTAYHVSNIPTTNFMTKESYPGSTRYISPISTKLTGIRMNRDQAYQKYVEIWTPNLNAWERFLNGNSSPK